MTISQASVGIGIDLGTQGARVLAVDGLGNVISRAQESWPLQLNDSDFREQDPSTWWLAITRCVRQIARELPMGGNVTITAAATSGTLVLADRNLKPVRPAIMWNDKRARIESDELNLKRDAGIKLGTSWFRPTFTLPKALWVMKNEPEKYLQVRFILSAGDWVLGQLRAGTPITDYTNALKSGADLDTLAWPDGLSEIGVNPTHLPEIVAPGTPIGQILSSVAEDWGLPLDTKVFAGMTDASAAQVASGAVEMGSWVSTIGTGLSIKGTSEQKIEDSKSQVYSHKHWNRGWIPSATSHCGADAIGVRFAGQDMGKLTKDARELKTSNTLVLPLATVGEFFPFHAPAARGFELGSSTGPGDLFRGYLEGVAFIERLALEKLNNLGASVTGPQVTMGGGAHNSLWMELRASVLGRSVLKAKETSSAFGAALIALAGGPEEISRVARLLVSYDYEVAPEKGESEMYQDRFAHFLDELRSRGYLSEAIT